MHEPPPTHFRSWVKETIPAGHSTPNQLKPHAFTSFGIRSSRFCSSTRLLRGRLSCSIPLVLFLTVGSRRRGLGPLLGAPTSLHTLGSPIFWDTVHGIRNTTSCTLDWNSQLGVLWHLPTCLYSTALPSPGFKAPGAAPTPRLPPPPPTPLYPPLRATGYGLRATGYAHDHHLLQPTVHRIAQCGGSDALPFRGTTRLDSPRRWAVTAWVPTSATISAPLSARMGVFLATAPSVQLGILLLQPPVQRRRHRGG